MPVFTRRSVLLTGSAMLMAGPALAQTKPKIGIIGSGKIGGELGKLWAMAGYPVMLSARDLGPVKELAAQIGHGVTTGSPAEAAAYGDVILISVPWGAVAEIGKDYGAAMKGKVVLDTCNPAARRDGPEVAAALEKGAGLTDQALLPGTRLVRAFNSIQAASLASQAGRAGEKAGIEIASDDKAALATASQLVRDAGFDPVVVGDLAKSKLFDPGTPVYPRTMTAKEMKAALNLP